MTFLKIIATKINFGSPLKSRKVSNKNKFCHKTRRGKSTEIAFCYFYRQVLRNACQIASKNWLKSFTNIHQSTFTC